MSSRVEPVAPGQVWEYEYRGKCLTLAVLSKCRDGGWNCLVLHEDNHWGYPAGMVGDWGFGEGWERLA